MVAMCIDAVLPALGVIALDFNWRANQRQWVIAVMFVGMTLGQYFYGPLADRFGRRRAFRWNAVVFMGSLMCFFAASFEQLLWGRLLQGIGVAGPRIVSTALIRDRFKGVEMAKVSSLIMTVFITVPVLAPMIGQVVLWVGDWRGLFAGFFLWCVGMAAWVWLRQPETLPEVRAFNLVAIASTSWEVLNNKAAMLYTLAVGISFGALLGFLMASQQIYQEYFQVEIGCCVFAASALAVGAASFCNSALVERFGMRPMVLGASFFGGVWTLLFAIVNGFFPIGLTGFVILLLPLFFLGYVSAT